MKPAQITILNLLLLFSMTLAQLESVVIPTRKCEVDQVGGKSISFQTSDLVSKFPLFSDFLYLQSSDVKFMRWK